MPAKADPDVQRDFLNDTLLPLIEKAKAGTVNLFFLDASHFVMGAFQGRVWSVVRRWVKTASGRKRFNVLGALNFTTKKVETVVNTTYITSTQVVEMLEKLSLKYIGKPIYIILDNARYQRCKFVFEAALRLNIELVFLPTYSPNLNLIERVWKLVKSRVLNSAYYETFDNFCSGIHDCVDSLHSKLVDEMTTLITQNFHIVSKDIIILQ
jgi:transposase